MNSKLMLILIAISTIIFAGIGTNGWWHSEENNTVDIESIEKQLEHLQDIQIDADRVFMEDEKVRDLINGKEYLKTLEIIHNGSYVEDFYRIGFQYKKLKERRGYRMVGGKIYKFGIDLSNKTVLSVEEAENKTPNVKEIKDDRFMDGTYTYVRSLALMRSYTGAWLSLSQKWVYQCRICGVGEVRLKLDAPSGAQGWGCLHHHLKLIEKYNKENFYLSFDPGNPERKKAWCNGDKLPRIESRLDRESITCEVIYPREGSVWEIIKPRNWPSNANFSYIWYVWVKPNQTIMFDVAVKLESIENARNTYETTHDWRVIFTSPPSPEGMSLAEMKEYGIEVGYYYCSYYAHIPVIVVKKEGMGWGT